MCDICIKETTYKNFGKCISISNGLIDIIVTVDVGPRIIRLGYEGKPNVYYDDDGLSLDVGGEEWRLRGGHRLWSSPEEFPRTYDPDNSPVEWEEMKNGIVVKSPTQKWVQTAKEMEITLEANSNKVIVIHKITNKNAWPIELAAWAMSVMSKGGREIIPIPQYEGHFSDGAKGAKFLTLWSYTKMNDSRVNWGDKYITLQQDEKIEETIKFGISNEDGWAAYLNNGNLYIKKFNYENGAKYPDNGVSYETFSNDFMLEMESISPLKTLKPEETIIYEEELQIFENVNLPIDEESQIDILVDKYITQ